MDGESRRDHVATDRKGAPLTALSADAVARSANHGAPAAGWVRHALSLVGDGGLLLGVILLIPFAIVGLGLPLAWLVRGLLEIIKLL